MQNSTSLQTRNTPIGRFKLLQPYFRRYLNYQAAQGCDVLQRFFSLNRSTYGTAIDSRNYMVQLILGSSARGPLKGLCNTGYISCMENFRQPLRRDPASCTDARAVLRQGFGYFYSLTILSYKCLNWSSCIRFPLVIELLTTCHAKTNSLSSQNVSMCMSSISWRDLVPHM